jgi:Phytanoyl-CoA dioxygenase (PhyH)
LDSQNGHDATVPVPATDSPDIIGLPALRVHAAAEQPLRRRALWLTVAASTGKIVAHDTLRNRDYWRDLAPGLHIADQAFLKPGAASNGAAGEAAGEAIDREGYTQLHALDLGADLAAMAGVARKLSAGNLDPVFAFVYDEFWRPFFRLDALYRHLLGDYAFLPNFWAWDVDGKRGGAGWGPHRDVGSASLMPDGSPKALTTWIALSRATPLNGCLYMVPSHADPTYGTEADVNWKFDYADIRALPAEPGDVLMWNQAVVHWGGKASPHAPESRVSMSLEVQRKDTLPAGAPVITPWQIVPFEQRLKMIGEKILHYRHMHAIGAPVVEIANELAV